MMADLSGCKIKVRHIIGMETGFSGSAGGKGVETLLFTGAKCLPSQEININRD